MSILMVDICFRKSLDTILWWLNFNILQQNLLVKHKMYTSFWQNSLKLSENTCTFTIKYLTRPIFFIFLTTDHLSRYALLEINTYGQRLAFHKNRIYYDNIKANEDDYFCD